MSKRKAVFYTILLSIIIFGTLFLSIFVRYENLSLFSFITAVLAGNKIGEALGSFYSRLRNRKE